MKNRERMRELFDKLRNKKDISLACSAGIVSLKDSSKFVYRDTLYKADQALYRSKEKGKNQYRYFELE